MPEQFLQQIPGMVDILNGIIIYSLEWSKMVNKLPGVSTEHQRMYKHKGDSKFYWLAS